MSSPPNRFLDHMTDREILVSIATTQARAERDREDHEARIRSLEKVRNAGGIILSTLVAVLGAHIKGWLGGGG
ncbi:MAG: hypothetical protein KGL39_15855 [Patescibacteria group bacterium]|nr:hypothetical protein [Patescibacteria group bacterium]